MSLKNSNHSTAFPAFRSSSWATASSMNGKTPTLANPDPPTLTVGGLPTAVVTRQRLAEIMAADCLQARKEGRSWRPRLVFSSNGQGIVLAASDPAFAGAMGEAEAWQEPRLAWRYLTTNLAAAYLLLTRTHR